MRVGNFIQEWALTPAQDQFIQARHFLVGPGLNLSVAKQMTYRCIDPLSRYVLRKTSKFQLHYFFSKFRIKVKLLELD